MLNFLKTSATNILLTVENFSNKILDGGSTSVQKAFEDIDTRLQTASDKSDGLMSRWDKGKLDNIGIPRIVTTPRIKILNDFIYLPRKALGDVVFNTAHVYINSTDVVITEYSCIIDITGYKVIFNKTDYLNGKYAVVSYISIS